MHRRLVQFLRAATLQRIRALLHSIGAQSSQSLGPTYPLLAGPALAALAAGGLDAGYLPNEPWHLCHGDTEPAILQLLPLCAIGIDDHGHGDRGAMARSEGTLHPT